MERLSHLRVFARSVEVGSFSAVGRQIGMAPSSVSRHVNELEEELGVRLFHRTTRRLSPTEAGTLLYERAQRILTDYDEAKLAVTQLDGTASGILRITMPIAIGRQLTTAILPDFMTRYPSIKLVMTMTDRLIDLVERGIDVAIRVGRQPDSTLIARQLGVSRRLLCAAPSYLRRAGEPRSPHDLSDHACLTFREHPGSNLWTFEKDGKPLEARVTGDIFAPSADALVAAAVAGLGIILSPDWNMRAELDEGKLVEILTDYAAIPTESPIYAVYPHQRYLPPKVRAFIDFLIERRSDLGAV
jgi:DNA-binding transcriptional LysR family regulator